MLIEVMICLIRVLICAYILVIVRFAMKFRQFAKIREKVCYSADMCCSGGKHPSTAGAELKILIFGAGGSSIRPLGTINRPDRGHHR